MRQISVGNPLVAMVSDVHFGEHQNNPIFLDMQIKWFINDLLPSLKEKGIQILFVLGDLFHNKETTNNLVRQRVYDLFREELKDITIVVSLGNHDLYFRDRREVNGLHGLKDIPNVKVIEKVVSLKLGKADIAIVPWMIDSKREEDIASIVAIKPDVVFGHFAFAGFAFNRLYPARHGEDAQGFSEAVKGVSRVYSGHYHTQSQKTFGEARFQYLGAPFQYTRIDEGEVKGWWTLNLDTLEDEFIPSKGITEFVRVSYPFAGTEDDLVSIVAGNIVEVDVPVTEFSTKGFGKFMDKLNSFGPYRSEAKLIGAEAKSPSSMSEGRTEEEVAEPLTPLDLIRDYIGTQSNYSEEYRLTLMAEMSKVYADASSSELA